MARASSSCSRVDPEGDVIHEDGIDAQASLEGAELLQPLSPLQGRRGQTDEMLQRAASIGVDADVVVQRPSSSAQPRE